MNPRQITLLLAFAAGLSACEEMSTQSEVLGDGTDVVLPPAKSLTIVNGGASLESSSPATFTVESDSTYTVNVSGGNGSGLWKLQARLDAAAVAAGDSVLALSPDLEVPGSATVLWQNALGQVVAQASAGSLSLHLHQGAINGEVTGATPASLDATFSGPLLVDCWVPRSMLPGATDGQGTTGGDGQEPLVQDAQFASDACKPWAAWR